MVEITTDNTFNIFKSKKFGYLGGSDFAVSDDGLTWSIIQHYTDLSLTNPSTALINGYYYIADDTGIRKTKDFNTFFDVNATISDDKHTNLNSFEWFQGLNGSWYIKYNADTDTGTFTYYADFDETTDSFVNAFNQFVLPTGGASGLQYVRGKYYIWQSGDKLYRADNFTDKFEQVKTDIAGNTNHKQFSSVVSDNYLYVYFTVDDKTYVRSSKTTNLIHWSEPVEVGNVELGSYFYNLSAISVYPSHEKVRTFDKILKVTANGYKQTVPISCLVFNSLQVQWEQNSTYQISFTTFDDGSVSYAMLSEEATIEFNGQSFIVKQVAEDANGNIDTKSITATHIYNEINRVRQRKTKTGTLTYSVQDVLSFYLDDKVANPLGFTYVVYGEFDKQQIENLGNSSGSDMISKITGQWPQAIIYPDNKLIRVYTPEAFAKDYGGRIDYLNNSSDVKMTVDSTTITNQVKVFGKQIENTSDNADDNAPVKYYFEPFIVSDQASIDQYGLHPMDDISDERFTDKSKMTVFAKGQLSPNPAVSIEVTMEDNEVPYAGEKRHLIAKPLNLETNLTVIGYTWYPFDNAQKNSLSFANLPSSILKTQANVNNRIRVVQLMARQAINAAKTGTRNFVSPTDPMKNDNNDIRTGDIWTLPLLDKKTKSLVRSVNVESEDDSDTNETIYTDPEKMDKINVQFSIWNGSQWLELSNQRTTNKLNDNINSVASQVQEAQAGIATAVQQAQDALDKADKAITDAGFANDTATTAKEVAENTAKDATQAKEDSATALTNAKDALEKAQHAIEDIANGKTDISALQTTVDDINTSLDKVSGDLDTAKGDLDKAAQQAKTNGESIVSINKDVGSLQTDVADTQGNVSEVTQQAKELSTAITNAKGDISTLQQTATQLSSSIKDNTDNISSVKQTATQLSSDMKDAQGNISSLHQSATSLSSTIGTIQKDLSDTKKTISTQGTQITQNAKDIISKASSADLDATNKRMTTAETSIKQNAKDITSKASQSDVNTLTGRVKTAESNITQNANNIKSKVTSSDVQGMLDKGGYATQSWTGSQIKQSADEINSTVTSVSNKVDNLQIGGRNLITNSSLTKGLSGWSTSMLTPTDDYTIWDIPNKGGSRRFVSYYFVDITNDSRFEIGESYTLSADLYVDSVNKDHGTDNAIFARAIDKNGSMLSNSFIDARFDLDSKGWHRYSDTNKLPEGTVKVQISFAMSADTFGKFRIKNAKLEKGTKATDWTPAPEDLATVTALSKVDQKADSISSTVTNNKKDTDSKFTTVNQTISGIQSTVKNKADSSTVTQLDKLVQSKVDSKDYNSKITQLANDINLRVQSKDLLSQINIQAGSTLIQSNKLYLDSSSVVFSGKAFIPSASIASLSADKVNTGVLTSKNGKTYFDLNNNLINIEANVANVNSDMKLNNGALNFSYTDINGNSKTGSVSFDYSLGYSDTSQIPSWLSSQTGSGKNLGRLELDSDDFIHFALGQNSELNMANVAKYTDNHTYKKGEGTLNAFSFFTNNGNVRLSSGDEHSHVKLQKKNRNGDWMYLSLGNSDNTYYNDASNDFMYLNASLFSFSSPKGNIARIGTTSGGAPMIQGDVTKADLWIQSQKGIILNGETNVLSWLGAKSLSVSGKKNAVVPTCKGPTLINAYETAEYYFGDLGQANTGASSEIVVPIDKVFSETVRTDIPYHVFVSSYSDSNVWVTDRTETSFTVHSSKPNADFSWELKAKRRGYEDDRLEIDNNMKLSDWNNYQEAKDAGASAQVLETYKESEVNG